MAESRHNWIGRLVLQALHLGLCAAAFGQSSPSILSPPRFVHIQPPQTGSLAGRLTNLQSVPLGGVSVTLHNQASGVEVRAITARNGSFRFGSLDAGEYTLEVDKAEIGHGHLEGILVTGGAEAQVQAAIRFAPEAEASHGVPGTIQAIETQAPIAMPLIASTKPTGKLAVPPLPVATPTPKVPIPTFPSSNPLLTASIETKPMRSLPLTARSAEETIHSTPERATSAETPSGPEAQPLLRTPNTSQRPELETRAFAMQPVLATAQLRKFIPPAGFASTLTVDTVLASGVQAVVRPALLFLTPVMAATQQADPVAGAVTSTVSAAQVQALPISGRRWQEFLLSTPTANAPVDSSQLSFRGAGQASSEITVDGASTSLAFGIGPGSGSQSSNLSGRDTDQQSSTIQSWTGGRGPNVSEAAIHEVETTAGDVEGEGMRSAGGRASIHTQSGGNEFHGQGFLFDRQNTWGARNPFTQWVQNIGSTMAPMFSAAPFTPPDHEIVWGLGMGSSIRRDKLFWFAALDSYRRNDPGIASVKNPGEFFDLPEPTSADVLLLSAQLGESQNQAYNDYLGVPASGYSPAGLEQLASLLGPAPRSAAQWLGFGRLDWQATERHRLTLEGIGADWIAPGGGLTRVSETYGNHSFGASHASQQWLLARWEAYLTPNLLAVTQASTGRTVLRAQPDTPSSFEQEFLAGNFWGQLPQIVVDSRYGFTIGNPSRFGQGSYPDEKLYHAQESVDWVRGKLLVKSGFELDHNSDATSMLRNQTGTYYYSSVANFISDALAFQKFGFADALDPRNPHNCGETDTKFGSQPCYSYFSQTMGPADWRLSTNDWAGYITAQWQAGRLAVVSTGMRWEREQLPPPIATLASPDLPQTALLPALGNNWGPRISIAIGKARGIWPVLRLGYGIYYGRVQNATIETALTQTGSLHGDLNFFMRPSDDCQSCSGGSPPFPYVFAGQPASVVKPGAVEFASDFRNSEVHQGVAAIEQTLPGRVEIAASAVLSLGRRLPISSDTNFDPSVNPGTITYSVKDPTGLGPIKATQITVPFYASWPSANSPTGTAGRLNSNYQQITAIMSRANSTYEAAMVRIVRDGRRGLSLHAHYTYAHAMDWNPNETTLVAGSDVLDPANFSLEYGTSDLDVRHSAVATMIFEAPWKLRDFAGHIGNGWMLSGIGQFRSGLPYTMRVSGSLPEEFTTSGAVIAGLGPGMNGSGGDNRVYGVGRNTFRYPDAWKADLRLAKHFNLGEMRQLELLAESFNLFNHQNVTELETTGYSIESGGASATLPTLCYLTINTADSASCGTSTTTGSGTPLPAFGRPLNINATNFYRERQIQLGLRMRF
jgi:hypothetical protein